MADKMNIKETNVTTVHEEDRTFIRFLRSLSIEKKILINGILIGLELQEQSIPKKMQSYEDSLNLCPDFSELFQKYITYKETVKGGEKCQKRTRK